MNIRRVFQPRTLGVLVFWSLLFTATQGRAERRNDLALSIDILSGASNEIGSGGATQEDATPFFSVYPSANLTSEGKQSLVELNYGFYLERHPSTPTFTAASHTFTTAMTAEFGKRFHFRLSDTFGSSTDFSLVNVLKEFAFNTEDFQYAFARQFYSTPIISNSGSAGLDIDLTERSFLTLIALGSYLHYSGGAVMPDNLSDQSRIEALVSFSRKLSQRSAWSLRYRFYQNDFERFAAARAHAGTLAYARELSRSVHLDVEAGPSYREAGESRKDQLSYMVLVNVSKVFRSNRYSLYYSHRPGDSTGIGSAADSNRVGTALSWLLGQNTSLTFDATAFQQKDGSSIEAQYKGLAGSIALSHWLGLHWVISAGGSYQIYQGSSAGLNNQINKRIFVSFGYRLKRTGRN